METSIDRQHNFYLRTLWSVFCRALHCAQYQIQKDTTRTAVAVVLAIFIFLSTQSSVYAGDGITIEPLYLELSLSESLQQSTGTITLTNDTASEQVVHFSAVNIHGEDDRGNVQFLTGVGGKETSAAEYISLSTNSAVLSAGAKMQIQVSAKNSQDLSPGGHYSALVARFSGQDRVNSPQIFPAVSTLVLTRKIGGERYHISLSAISKSDALFAFQLPRSYDLTFANEGNIHVVPHGTIELFDVLGRRVKKGIINESSSIVLPGNRRTLHQDLYMTARSFPLMMYSVRVSGSTTPGDVPFSRQFSFIYISSTALIVIGGVLLVGVVAGYSLRRRRR